MKARKPWLIPVSKVPRGVHIHDYILAQTDLKTQIQKLGRIKYPVYLKSPLQCSSRSLKKSVLEGLQIHGSSVFQRAGLKSYHSAELTKTLVGTQKSGSFDNTYTQIQKTRLADHGHIGKLLQSFDRPILKSRIAVLKSQQEETQTLGFMWHQDESIFLNLRVNIPIITSDHYAIQILGSDQRKTRVHEFSMATGHAYVYNTGLPHRAYCKKLNKQDRIHLIVGCSPWFDFDLESKTWISNEFYGEVHPFEMFKKGLISSLISKTR